MQVTFLPHQIQQLARPGEQLMAIAAEAGVIIDGNCGSSGTCGRCRIQIVSGIVAPPDQAESAVLTAEDLAAGFRLACRIIVQEDLCIKVPGINKAKDRKTKMMTLLKSYRLGSSVHKYYFKISQASLDDQKDDLSRILSALQGKATAFAPELLSQIPWILEKSDRQITAVVRDSLIIGLEPGDTTDRLYGVAFDIGTTTVVGMLWDLSKGELLGIKARTNPQKIYGADVISRINSANTDQNALIQMKVMIRDCLNEIIGELMIESDWISLAPDNHETQPVQHEIQAMQHKALNKQDIYDVTVVGNTTMSHLFMGVNPAQLAMAPFVPVFCDAVSQNASNAALTANPLAQVLLLPNIAGHVGSDIVAVILASDLIAQKGLRLVIDVGTNGEIVLAQNGMMLACSTAAGPAFEGASIFQGMRATEGAIESVQIIGGDVVLSIIDSETPIGLCGSGLIDAVAQLLDAGLLDAKGRLMDQQSARDQGLPEPLVQRLRDGAGGREFVLAWGSKSEQDIVLTQKDIREVQLAKGAIHAGILILLQEMGAAVKDLASITLAGAFGNYIRKESGLRIGLLPEIPIDQIISAGNAAGSGASLALLSQEERCQALELAKAVRHVELAAHPEFQAEFLKSMYFPEGSAAK
jgi:uncharacterized 2Fe-2S/4Fe-4S cluster protein (DUF4445 family)